MRQDELRAPKGAKRPRKRLGRGDSSGHGSYSGKGMKGQNSRSGGGVRPSFEGGQLPLTKALPRMRGFTNIFRRQYRTINVDSLSRFLANSTVTPELLAQAGVLRNLKGPLKVLGRGEIDVPLAVEAQRFSVSARKKIEAAGGSVKEVS